MPSSTFLVSPSRDGILFFNEKGKCNMICYLNEVQLKQIIGSLRRLWSDMSAPLQHDVSEVIKSIIPDAIGLSYLSRCCSYSKYGSSTLSWTSQMVCTWKRYTGKTLCMRPCPTTTIYLTCFGLDTGTFSSFECKNIIVKSLCQGGCSAFAST